jgi:signal transduction histidine kinase
MVQRFGARVSIFVRLIAIAASLVGRDAAAATTKNIVVIHTYDQNAPFRLAFDPRVAEILREKAPGASRLYFETLESNRFPGEAHALLFRDYLRQKYADLTIDVVIAVWDRALAFTLAHRDVLFHDASIVALLAKVQSFSPDLPITTVRSGNQVGETAELALALHPGTRRIAVVDGTVDGNNDVQEEFAKELEPLRDRLEIIYLRDLPLADLLSRVESLPADTVLFFARQTIRTRDQPIEVIEALHQIVRVARVPIYGAADRLVGEGLVGGWVFSSAGDAALVAEAALRIASGVPVRDIPSRAGVTLPMFDWRQLQRWGVPETSLPPGSEVRFREQTFWNVYGRYAVVALAVMLGQAALIAGLLLHRSRRRRAEASLREHQSELLRSHEEIRALAGRLIMAQEAERSRIGRELHDDIGQKLALLHIDVTQLSQVSRVQDRDLSARIRRIADLASTITDDLQNASRQMHPGQLHILGLGQTLRLLCRDMSTQYRPLVVEIAADHVPRDLAPDVALCIYRVVQEALHNVVKHSGAAHALVRLTHHGQTLSLEITDSGRGFQGPHRAGLGLLSMRERVLFLGGQFRIESTPGRGTCITAQVPALIAHEADQHIPCAEGASA